MGTIELKGVRKAFGDVVIIPSIDLEIRNGEFVVFVGPSGCGKSTLLRLIAGLEDVTSGRDHDRRRRHDQRSAGQARPLHGVPVLCALSAYERAEQHRLRPQDGGRAKPEIDAKVDKAAATLNLTDYLDRKPRQLSGGQRQRVAIGRAIVRQPKAFLFDEPLSNLDAALRVQMRLEITQLHQALETTMIYVTHDQVEAMTMADRIVVLNKGNIEQVGSPLDLYNKPANLFVAGFIGSPKMNLLQGQMAQKHNAATVGIRPEHITASRERGEWEGTVRVAEHLGSDTFLHVDAEELGQLTVRAPGEMALAAGDRIWLTPRPGRIHRFDANGKALQT